MRRCLLAVAVAAIACGRYPAAATVTVAVSGPGSVHATQLQGDCRATCWFSVDRETPVHLEAVGDADAVFMGWSGACSGPGACDLKPDVDASVAASFAHADHPTTVSVEIDGSGTVVSTPAAIDCPRICSAEFAPAMTVTLTASAAPGFSFAGFGGDCRGTTCSLRLAGPARVTAAFSALPVHQVSVALSGDGAGHVISTPGGIDCPGTCAAAFPEGTALTLKATADALSRFVDYGGSCAGADCAITVRADAAVSVQFLLRRYVAVDLGVPSGGNWSRPNGISRHGLLVAGAWGDGLHGFLWNGAIGDLGLTEGQAMAVNDDGVVVGASMFGSEGHAIRWKAGVIGDLGAGSEAVAINASGVIAGSARGPGGTMHAVIWTQDGIVDLGSLGGDAACSEAMAINSDGVVVGESCAPDGGVRAVRFRAPGVIDDLGSLGGSAMALGINDNGVIVGWSHLPDGTCSGFVYADGQMTDAGRLSGMASSALVAVNGAGIAVGYAASEGADLFRAVVYRQGRMIDLNAVTDGVSYAITEAYGIDEAGNIVAGVNGPGVGRSVLLFPQ